MFHVAVAVALSFVAVLSSSAARAADLNGYQAQYECRAGAPHCNLDVAALANQPCEQMITPATTPTNSWSAIDWSRNVICIAAGDHTARGVLRLGSSGSPSRYKVLRYYRAGDNDDEPWNQTESTRAKIRRIEVAGADYWIVHRLTLDANNGNPGGDLIWIRDGSTNLVFNRLLVEEPASAKAIHFNGSGYNSGINAVTIQNSVIRRVNVIVGYDVQCFAVANATNVRIVNNEIYDCPQHIMTAERSIVDGMVVENNDLYTTPARFTDCRGNYTNDPNAPCAVAEGIVAMKYTTASANPSGPVYRLIHNRMWGGRRTDTNRCCGSGTLGQMISLTVSDRDGNASKNVLVQNNIIMDGQIGVQTPIRAGARNHSIIGNIFYKIRQYDTSFTATALDLYAADRYEVYLNSVIDSAQYYANLGGTETDFRCNAFIAAGSNRGTGGYDTVVDDNVFYGSTRYTVGGTDNNISRAIGTHAPSTRYNAGDVVRWGDPANCRTEGDASCFLYMAIAAGTTASTRPTACNSLGCTFDDGAVVWQAIRGPYKFYRKLRTAPEPVVIPYARVHASAPEYRACPANLGARVGLGVDNGSIVP